MTDHNEEKQESKRQKALKRELDWVRSAQKAKQSKGKPPVMSDWSKFKLAAMNDITSKVTAEILPVMKKRNLSIGYKRYSR